MKSSAGRQLKSKTTPTTRNSLSPTHSTIAGAMTGSSVDYSTMSSGEIIGAILERNKDPIIEKMVHALIAKIPQEVNDAVEKDKREKSIVIHNIPEADQNLPPTSRQKDLKRKVSAILDILEIECTPLEMYRMGRVSNNKNRLVKVVFPSRTHWHQALRNSHRLRNSEFSGIFVRRSMTPAEWAKEKELRNEAMERNRAAGSKTWVVYRSELRRVEDLVPRNRAFLGRTEPCKAQI